MKGKPKQEQGGIKQVTVRLRSEDWRRIAHLAVDEDTSIHELIIRGLNHILKEHGQAGIKVQK
jgi:hypothetical protein